LIGLLFNPENGYIFLRNAGWLLTDYTALYLRRDNSPFKEIRILCVFKTHITSYILVLN
jgi:hypothetical protein